MQTFLPYKDFEETARVLDWRRLGKQRVEADQILNIVSGKTKKLGWRNHPAVKIWVGYEEALVIYRNTIIREWIRRGYKNNMVILPEKNIKDVSLPDLIGVDEYHLSHQSNLLRKDPEYYGRFFVGVSPDAEYLWRLK